MNILINNQTTLTISELKEAKNSWILTHDWHRIASVDAYGFSELVTHDQTGYAYFLFDSWVKPFVKCNTFCELATFVCEKRRQTLLLFDDELVHKAWAFERPMAENFRWLGSDEEPITEQSVIVIETGKDWIFLELEPDSTFAWVPLLDPSYRLLGEKILRVRDAILKIDEMPVYGFSSIEATRDFFKTAWPKPTKITSILS